uniref:LAGLIDADG homing endonuclease n=1 Tax=Romanomermis culicivorax TaxID=13658 RepID=A0A915JBD7_ROMCU
MKLCVKRSKLIGEIGTMLLGFFDGSSGEKFKNVVSTFCQNQQYALEILKLKQKKD